MAGDAAAGEPEPERGPLVSGQILEWDDDGIPVYYCPEAAGKGAGRGRGRVLGTSSAGTGAGRGRGRVLGTSSAGSLPAPEQERGFPDGDCRDSCLLGVVLLLGWVLRVRGERMRRRDEGER